ncbi:MAG: hypothetical protein GY835_20905 [bacterium]|nr:hypothetical protein [bacterium]
MTPEKVSCPGCSREYVIPGKMLSGTTLRVKCPRCGQRFGLRVSEDAESVKGIKDLDEEKRDTGGKHWPAVPVEADPPPGEDPSPAEPIANNNWKNAAEAVGAPAKEEDLRVVIRRARRLSRALIQEMVLGQRERRDKALAEGSLLLEFGEDIRKNWDLYTEKVGQDIARNTSYFRDALNEFLADGRRLF